MATYEPIANTTLGSNTASYTFSSIPNTYKDLVLRVRGEMVTAGWTVYCQLNADTGNNYYTFAVERQWTNATIQYNRGGPSTGFGLFGWGFGYSGNNYSYLIQSHFNNYSASTKKMILTESGAGSSGSNYTAGGFYAGMWDNTSAISSIKVYTNDPTGVFQTGTNFTLWGLK